MKDEKRSKNVGTGIAIGLSIGLLFGIATDDLAIGVAIGLALGVAVAGSGGFGMKSRKKPTGDQRSVKAPRGERSGD